MFPVLFDYLVGSVFGFVIGRNARNTAQTARNTAEIAKLAAMTDAQKVAFQKRQTFLAGERRFVYIVFALIVAVAWVASALTGH